MDAAQQIVDAVVARSQDICEAKLASLVAANFSDRGYHTNALQLSVGPLAKARRIPTEAVALKLPAVPKKIADLPETQAAMTSIAELAATAKAELATEGNDVKALARITALFGAVSSIAHMPLTAVILSALSLAHVALGGESRDAARAAAGAVKAARQAEDQRVLLSTLSATASASFGLKDPDEALRLAQEASRVATGLKDVGAEASAQLAMAKAALANQSAKQGLESSSRALELFKSAKDAVGQAAARAVICDIHLLLGDTAAATKEAEEAVKLVGKNNTALAAAKLLQGSVNAGGKDASNACREAVDLFKKLGDAAGEGAAQLFLSSAQLFASGASYTESLQTAKEGLAIFKKISSKAGEAAALVAVAAAQTAGAHKEEAEQAAREALTFFRELKDIIGEACADKVLSKAKVVALQTKDATVTIDKESGIAHVEVSDSFTKESLVIVIDTLQASSNLACVVLNLTGSPTEVPVDHVGVKSLAVFLMGLRMVALPVVCSICGKISGPMWSLVLAADYRIAATSSIFVCPLWGLPSVMGQIVGHNSAVQLCMATGPRDALVLLEHGVMHQLQKGKEDTRRAAAEMAKRVASTPDMACRKQPHLMTQAMEEYVVGAAQGKVAP